MRQVTSSHVGDWVDCLIVVASGLRWLSLAIKRKIMDNFRSNLPIKDALGCVPALGLLGEIFLEYGAQFKV